MKLLHITNTIRLGGVESLLLMLLPPMVAQGHSVDLLVLNSEALELRDAFEAAGVRVIAGRYRSVYDPRNVGMIGRVVKAGGYDVVHTHLFPGQYYVAMARFIWGKRTACWVTSEQGSDNGRRGKKILLPLERWVYNRFDQVVAVSGQATETLRKWLGWNKGRIVTICNGVDHRPIEQAASYTNTEMGLPPEARSVIMLARFCAAKDHTTAIKAMAFLPENVYLLLVGSGEQAQYVKLAQELGVAERVKFMGRRDDVYELLKSVDISLLASHGEGLSISMIESMAAHRPMVGSRVNGIEELLEDYGVLYEHQNAEDLATKISEILENKENYAYLSAKCYERALQFDIARTVEQHLSLYQQCSKN